MKILLAFLLAASTALAADPITVDGNMNVIVGNSTFGRAEDYIAANPGKTGEVMLAIRAFHASVIAEADAKKQEAVAAIEAAAQKVAEAETSKAAEAARTTAIVAALAQADQAKLPDDVKSAMLTAAEKEREALAKQKADIEAKLAALPK